MAWNEPGNNNPDPWGKRKSPEQPPDLDELFKKVRQKWGEFFGNQPSLKSNLPSRANIGIIAAVIAVGFIIAGYYSVEEGSQAVILRFGRYSHTVGSGPHWRIPFIDDKTVVDVERVRSYKREGVMLTSDENIVDIDLDIQYKINDVDAYVLTAREPDFLIQQGTESALRQVVGRTDLDTIMTGGREEVSGRVKQQLQELLSRYKVGLVVTQVNMQKAAPPEQVKAAFDDVIRAREDKERYIGEAETYANQVIPLAKGDALKIEQEAIAYKESVLAEAKGKSSRFRQLLTEYEKAPEVTRERLYVETLEHVLGKTSKVLVEGQNGNSPLFYLPLDKMVRQQPTPSVSEKETTPSVVSPHQTHTLPELDLRDNSRLRERGSL